MSTRNPSLPDKATASSMFQFQDLNQYSENIQCQSWSPEWDLNLEDTHAEQNVHEEKTI